MAKVPTENERVEKYILAAIRKGNTKFADIWRYVVSAMKCQYLDARVVDKGLQRLRKRGVISFDSCIRWWTLES